MPDVKFTLSGGNRKLDASIRLPEEPLRPQDLMPLAFGLTNALVQLHAAHAVEDEGRIISCQAGCGACCRQLVPISEPEALHLATVIERMEPERKAVILERLRRAQEQSAELLAGFAGKTGWDAVQEMKRVGVDYFRLGIPCPFLENESCGIYEDRPAKCREYLATSAPEHCASLDFTQIKTIPVTNRVSAALMFFAEGGQTREARIVLITQLLEWLENAPQGPEKAPAEMFESLMRGIVTIREEEKPPTDLAADERR